MMEIKRNYYLNKLISKQNNKLIKIVTGIRRCGKSYLLDPIFRNYLLENGSNKYDFPHLLIPVTIFISLLFCFDINLFK